MPSGRSGSSIWRCSPLRLLLPGDVAEPVVEAVTPAVKVGPADLWAWCTGERPLRPPGSLPLSGSARAMWTVENRPDLAADVATALERRRAVR
jgi:hypothetical protein